MALILNSLSRRHLQILLYLVEGCDYRTVARNLHLKYETIKTYVATLRKRLAIRSRTEMALWAAKRLAGVRAALRNKERNHVK